ncbi:uncharacterized protein LOC132559484 [Ylistrum balloti]|uniref:uncharacterized protein LOC132559484 n=1 Tax=Ylistrum balloti TaxID=509963 RepID=UPI0029058DE1|nr:uncharacterized protein LOC132559484 [Ylistrum balloti]XP_060080094.1 uncharacterized protein LOC132559484 [Ylistrum balloti]
MKTVPGLLQGLSYCRLIAMKSSTSRYWTNLSGAIVSSSSNLRSTRTVERHFSMLTCGVKPSNSVLCNTRERYNCHITPNLSTCPVFYRNYTGRKPRFMKAPHVLMPDFPVVLVPTFRQFLYQGSKDAKDIKAIIAIEKDFVVEEFLKRAYKGTLTVADLLASRKVSDVEELFTPEAYRQVAMNYDKLTPEHFAVLHDLSEKKLLLTFKFHHVQMIFNMSEEEPAVKVNVKFLMSFFSCFLENKRVTELFINTAGFDRQYISRIDKSMLATPSKIKKFKAGIMSTLTDLHFESDDYWKILGITFCHVLRDNRKVTLI